MILTVTPVALTALATAFAGLSSSAMTQAMYHRSLAAQHQSRAGNQWAFFQAKRIRGNGIESSVEVLQALGHPEPFDGARAGDALARMQGLLNDPRAGPPGGADGPPAGPAVQRARDRLGRLPAGGFILPTVEPTSLADPAARQAYEEAVQAVQKRKTEAETV